jgi:16S rRNA processing protein RimM
VLLTVGRVGRAQGIRGEVVVEVRTDDPEGRFAPGAALATDPPHVGPLVVGRIRWHGQRLVVRFRNTPDRGAAEALQGVLLQVDVPDDARPEDPDEYYDHQLVGLAVVTVDGAEVGEVAEVLHLPSQELLAVRRDDGSEALVPFVAAIVPEVDLAGRRLVIDPPEGLLDLAGAATAAPHPDEGTADRAAAEA